MKNIIKYLAVLVACLALPAMAAINPKVIYAGIDADGATVAIGYDAFDVVKLKNSGSDPATGLYKLSYKKDDGTEVILDSSVEEVAGGSEVIKQFLTDEFAGVYECTATWTVEGTPLSKVFTVTVVGISKIQWKVSDGGYADVPTNGLYVEHGTVITLKAIPDPETADFPSGYPTWSGSVASTAASETVDSSITEASTSMTDVKTVTATCGTSYVSEDIISWEDTAEVTWTLEADGSGTTSTLYFDATYTLWMPDDDGDGVPDADGGYAVLETVEDLDDATDPSLSERLRKSFQNGIEGTVKYAAGTCNSDETDPDVYNDEPSDDSARENIVIITDGGASAATVGALAKAAAVNTAIGTAVGQATAGFVKGNVITGPASGVNQQGQAHTIWGDNIGLATTTTASCNSPKKWEWWLYQPSCDIKAVSHPANITANGWRYWSVLTCASNQYGALLDDTKSWTPRVTTFTASGFYNGRSKTINNGTGWCVADVYWGRAVDAGAKKWKNHKRDGNVITQWFHPTHAKRAEISLSTSVLWP